MADDLGDDWWVKDVVKDTDNQSGEKVNVKTKKSNKVKKESTKKKSKKRKLKEIQNEEKPDDNKDENQPEKKKKKKKKKKKVAVEDKQKEPPSLELLWTFFQTELEKTLSEIEIEDLKPKDSDNWYLQADETDHAEINNLSPYLKHVIPNLKTDIEKVGSRPGSPSILIITSSAVRAVNLLRASAVFTGKTDCKTIKLFAKHLKIDDQIEKLKKPVHFAIGTPNRILKLIESGALNTRSLKHIIIDWSWEDQKKRTITTMPDVKEDLLKLFQNYFLTRCKKKKCAIGCF